MVKCLAQCHLETAWTMVRFEQMYLMLFFLHCRMMSNKEMTRLFRVKEKSRRNEKRRMKIWMAISMIFWPSYR
jgi:hypothetical protein